MRAAISRFVFRELKRRRVFRGAGVYAGTAFIVVQAAAIVIPALHLPDWSLTFVVVLAILGFPIAVVLGWMYDLTSEGIQRTRPLVSEDAVPLPEPSASVGRRVVLVAGYMGLGAMVGIVTLAVYFSARSDSGPAGSSAGSRSIAVLPFRNLSSADDQEYFADGMTEELINALANLPGLRVVARSSAFAYKGRSQDVREVGEELGVRTILEGSVRREGDRLRLTVHLVDVESGYEIWSQRFDRTIQDVFAIQEEIAGAVADRVRRQTGDARGEFVMRRSTEDVEAYQLYLQGRFHWNLRTPEGMREAIDFFQLALARDSLYGLAYSGLADVLIGLSLFGVLPAEQMMPKAEAAALRAVTVDPWLGEAHASLAHIYEYYRYDWEAAQREYEKAVELNPTYVDAHSWRGQFLVHAGRFDEGLAALRRAVALEPLHIPGRFTLAMGLYNARRFDESILESRQILEMVPSYWPASLFLAFALVEESRIQEALAAVDAAERLVGPLPFLEVARGYAHARAGREREARLSLARLEEVARHQYVQAQNFAVLLTALGEEDRAMDYLEQAYRERWPLLHSIRVAPLWDELRGHPRFTALEKTLGFSAAGSGGGQKRA
ncbi:MAG: tetratricopeptide repeat protein [Gemmatimonadetes bacterium]|nr:tetratricopeptide repeat protein [Gemmatimonadota bacterium]